MTDRDDLIDAETGQVRVLATQCDTCVFWPDDRMKLGAARTEAIINANVGDGTLLTCHKTLPYGSCPDFGPAVCAGFWARHGMNTAAGRFAAEHIGIIKVPPPNDQNER